MRKATFAAFALMALGFGLIAASPTTGIAGGKKVIEPFNGKDLTGWKFRDNNKAKSKWVVGYAKMDEKNPSKLVVSDKGEGPLQLINQSSGVDLLSEAKFGDAVIEVEFMVPKGSNSGVYVMGEYELQIYDSYGKVDLKPGDLGGLYGNFAPKVNASKKAGEWQKFVIDYQAPRFKDGKKISGIKFAKVTLNDQMIHENAELKAPTGGALTNKESPAGPLMFQGDHGPVAFRNIRITPK